MVRLAGCILALDGVLVTLDQSGAPPALGPDADETDRALHAHATERALLATIALRGLVAPPTVSARLDALAAHHDLLLLSEQTRAVTYAVLDATGWRDHFRTVLSADDVPPRPSVDGHRAALARLPRTAAGARALSIEATADGVHAARAAGCLVIACGRPMDGVPFIGQLGDLDEMRLAALLRAGDDHHSHSP